MSRSFERDCGQTPGDALGCGGNSGTSLRLHDLFRAPRSDSPPDRLPIQIYYHLFHQREVLERAQGGGGHRKPTEFSRTAFGDADDFFRATVHQESNQDKLKQIMAFHHNSIVSTQCVSMLS